MPVGVGAHRAARVDGAGDCEANGDAGRRVAKSILDGRGHAVPGVDRVDGRFRAERQRRRRARFVDFGRRVAGLVLVPHSVVVGVREREDRVRAGHRAGVAEGRLPVRICRRRAAGAVRAADGEAHGDAR